VAEALEPLPSTEAPMAGLSESMSTVTTWVGDLVRLLVGVGVFLIVAHIVYPGTAGTSWGDMNVLGNLSGFVDTFTTSITGLITLVVLLAFARK
jgi:hypothetical protein